MIAMGIMKTGEVLNRPLGDAYVTKGPPGRPGFVPDKIELVLQEENLGFMKSGRMSTWDPMHRCPSLRGFTQKAKNMFLGATERLSSLDTFNPRDNGLV